MAPMALLYITEVYCAPSVRLLPSRERTSMHSTTLASIAASPKSHTTPQVCLAFVLQRRIADQRSEHPHKATMCTHKFSTRFAMSPAFVPGKKVQWGSFTLSAHPGDPTGTIPSSYSVTQVEWVTTDELWRMIGTETADDDSSLSLDHLRYPQRSQVRPKFACLPLHVSYMAWKLADTLNLP